MALSDIIIPTEYYPDPTSGRPIALGQVFIGEPDTEPTVEANRKTVFLIQEDGNIVTILPAAQPLTTGAGGVVLFSGSSVQVQTDGNYSIDVRRAPISPATLGTRVYYFADVFDGVEDQNAFFQAATFYNNDAASASNAYVIIPPTTPRPTQYTDGMVFIFRPSDPNSGDSTIDVVGDTANLGVKTLTLSDGSTDPASGFFDTARDYLARYDSGLDVVRIIDVQVNAEAIPDGSITTTELDPAIVTDIDNSIKTISYQIFTANDTWNKPANLRFAEVTVTGGGGSGGKSPLVGGGGGGAAGNVFKFFAEADLSASESVVVGTGGPSQTVDNTDGTNGGDSTFKGLTGAGGKGGDEFSGAGGASGLGSGGDINSGLGYGHDSVTRGTGNDGGGNGGGPGGGGGTAAGGPGTIGTAPGGGGGGSVASNSGAGADGIVIVKEYIG